MLLHLASYSQCQTVGKKASHLWIHEWCPQQTGIVVLGYRWSLSVLENIIASSMYTVTKSGPLVGFNPKDNIRLQCSISFKFHQE